MVEVGANLAPKPSRRFGKKNKRKRVLERTKSSNGCFFYRLKTHSLIANKVMTWRPIIGPFISESNHGTSRSELRLDCSCAAQIRRTPLHAGRDCRIYSAQKTRIVLDRVYQFVAKRGTKSVSRTSAPGPDFRDIAPKRNNVKHGRIAGLDLRCV